MFIDHLIMNSKDSTLLKLFRDVEMSLVNCNSQKQLTDDIKRNMSDSGLHQQLVNMYDGWMMRYSNIIGLIISSWVTNFDQIKKLEQTSRNKDLHQINMYLWRTLANYYALHFAAKCTKQKKYGSYVQTAERYKQSSL